ncbi:YwiC-like family protein [Trueperella bonasi]|uniref:YwiC-like family protein n=1 Tax=Trueperella bonasi TaxID=312286 RepID=UPI0038998343
MITQIRRPHLVRWLPVDAPLIAITAWASTHRKDRSMVNNIATVGAACLTLLVAVDMGPGSGADWPRNFTPRSRGISCRPAGV